jgi:hypothetical protein
MLHGYIIDPETGKNVAIIRHGEVFRDDKEGARIAIVLNAHLYDLSGNLVGRLEGQHVIDVGTWVMPIAFRNLLEGTRSGPKLPRLEGPNASSVGRALARRRWPLTLLSS